MSDEYSVFISYRIIVFIYRYLVTTLQFSRGGVIHNFGVPQLTKLELRLLEATTLKIKECQEMAEQYVHNLRSGKHFVPPFKAKEIEREKLLKQSVLTK